MDEQAKYAELARVLDLAYTRASQGKGKERHADERSFTDQDILTEQRTFGISPILVQVRKKAKEVLRLSYSGGMNELLDVIVYACAGYLYLEEKENECSKIKEVTQSARLTVDNHILDCHPSNISNSKIPR